MNNFYVHHEKMPFVKFQNMSINSLPQSLAKPFLSSGGGWVEISENSKRFCRPPPIRWPLGLTFSTKKPGFIKKNTNLFTKIAMLFTKKDKVFFKKHKAIYQKRKLFTKYTKLFVRIARLFTKSAKLFSKMQRYLPFVCHHNLFYWRIVVDQLPKYWSQRFHGCTQYLNYIFEKTSVYLE